MPWSALPLSSLPLSSLPLSVLELLPLAAEESAPAGGGLSQFLMPIAIVFTIFYFLVIRPGSKERRAKEERMKSLAKHTKVITNAGIHGTVVASDEETVTLRVDDKNNVRMRFSKAAIWQVLDGEGEKASASAS